ncbi:non-ribosomal peptide synthetase PvdI [Perkinsela sp. CCAP 1560/4]|nr:non-ribosomal peptide synthetase PvdI [Perkinsela sp. CCAP 1560/4]|eukprot:KNH08133.1 non-ribosomal peptide synthetase PvdI [Perkinsela sp. CCAP 1560/4]
MHLFRKLRPCTVSGLCRRDLSTHGSALFASPVACYAVSHGKKSEENLHKAQPISPNTIEAASSKTDPNQHSPLYQFLSCCEKLKVSPENGVNSKNFQKFLKKQGVEDSKRVHETLLNHPLLQHEGKTAGTIALPSSCRFIAEYDRMALCLRCQLLEKIDAIEKYAAGTPQDGISEKAFMEAISQIALASDEKVDERLIVSLRGALAYLWLFDPQSMRYYSVGRKLTQIAQMHAQDVISFRALQALIQLHFPISWTFQHPQHTLPALSDYSIIPYAQTQQAILIDWKSVLHKACEIVEREFQKSVADSPEGTVLSRKIPMECFDNILKDIIPHYPKCMPKVFSLEKLIEMHFQSEFEISTDKDGVCEVQPQGKKDSAWFEERVRTILRESPCKSSDGWMDYEAVIASIDTIEKTVVTPAECGAQSWLDLLKTTPNLEYAVQIRVREKLPK